MLLQKLEETLNETAAKLKAAAACERTCIDEINKISAEDKRGTENAISARIKELDGQRRQAVATRRAACREYAALRGVLAKLSPLLRKD